MSRRLHHTFQTAIPESENKRLTDASKDKSKQRAIIPEKRTFGGPLIILFVGSVCKVITQDTDNFDEEI